MGVDIHKAGRDQLALGVDLFIACGQNPADLGDAAVADSNIGFEQLAAKTIGNSAAADHEIWILGHRVSSRIVEFCCRIMRRRYSKSTGSDEVQGCKTLPSDFSAEVFEPSSV